MKSEPSIKFKNLVKDSSNRYRHILGAARMYEIGFIWAQTDKESDAGHDFRGDVLGSTNVDRRYLRAKITIYPKLWKEWEQKKMDDLEVQEIIAHEVSHIATQHLYEVGTATYRDSGEMHDAWETCTEQVARLVLDVAKKYEKKDE